MIRIASLLLLTIVTTATRPSAWAADPAVTSINFETRRGHLIVADAQVEGTTLRSLIDTGANRSVIDTRMAKRLDLHPVASNDVTAYGKTSKVERVIIRSLRVGPIHTAALAIVTDLSDWGVDAIIGMDVLRRSDFGIDFTAKQILFGKAKTLSDSIPFDFEHSLVIVSLEVRGHKVRLSVDTGASRITLHQTDNLKQIVRSPATRFGLDLKPDRHIEAHGGSLARCAVGIDGLERSASQRNDRTPGPRYRQAGRPVRHLPRTEANSVRLREWADELGEINLLAKPGLARPGEVSGAPPAAAPPRDRSVASPVPPHGFWVD